MSGERFIDGAITALAAHLRAHLPGRLRQVETELGLAAGSLADPIDYFAGNVPTDNATPLVQVFDTAGQCTSQSIDEWELECWVVLTFAGDANLATNEATMRRYATALRDCLRLDETLGGTVGALDIMSFTAGVKRGNASTARYGIQFTVRVGFAG